ncbi:hypothetical protein L0Z42_14030 [Burkholderia multivorans]|uniref:DUF6600 domain-containing protein n=1 Tax=Burkholderia multivorans TaxID=87883 RepID=UPI002019C83D|nr:DUF6600 domain-containing protein [Burkholderia multivorans]MCO1371648.1 hypothetical protein [Burkholderia multivorans]MCO1457105.1 hypothetical protein [Burkholderia multivorans]MCO1466091.1 hypothetical protein [Burkholderia multivorans]UQO16209.1 hypothetical protein L0Z02_11460 [Burkholderia multivorans]UQO86423.1 hypothetical protein L0Y86_14990 [Burkholderia multivorans]
MAFLFAPKRTTRVTLFAVAALAALPPVFAQTAAPAPYAAAAQPSAGDPPGRVARLNYLSGAVTTEPAGTDAWSYAAVNRPLTTGDQLWNDAGARSELHIGSTAVRLGASTSLSVLNLDDSTTQLKVGLGTLSTHVRALPAGTSYEIDTPNLALGITAPGDYRVDVAPDGASTTVTVRSGSATVYGSNGQYPLSAGQQAVFTGTDLQITQQSAALPPDALDRWAAGRDAAEDRSVSVRYVSRDIPGYQDLDANGTWRDTPAYGPVWVPNDTPADWAPYHDGHWIWQAPWGWTWVDDAPWGFAPYHYGRWAYVDDRWAWVPGPTAVSAPPAYAPALVAFVGGGDGPDWSVALTVGGVAAAGCAWFALGPGEPWHPAWGGWSPHYYERVNRNIVVNRITVNNTVNVTNVHNTYVNFGAPHAIAAVPATAFVHGQPVARFAQHVDPRQWRNAHVVPGTPGIAPVRQSFTGGLRTASYRPPAAIGQHPFVATRNPAVPAAYRDEAAAHLVRKGEHVPGAGTPIAKTSVPPDYAARPVRVPGAAHTGAWAMRNVQLVNPHGPLVHPAPRNATAAPMPPQAGRPGVPGAVAFVGPHGPNGARPAADGRAMPPAANGDAAHAPGNAQARAAFAGAGAVPHPPATAAGVIDAAHGGQPAWMQPHTPLARQRPTPAPAATAALPGAGEHATPPIHGVTQPPQAQRVPDARQAPEQSITRREAPRTSTQPPLQTAQIPQPRPDFREPARHAQPQPQPERAVPAPRPQRDFAQPVPHHEAAPPRANEFRPPAVAREMPRPQPPAPRMESHPPMPAPHVEQRAPMPAPHIAPRPQPAPHAEAPHPANPPHGDEQRRH